MRAKAERSGQAGEDVSSCWLPKHCIQSALFCHWIPALSLSLPFSCLSSYDDYNPSCIRHIVKWKTRPKKSIEKGKNKSHYFIIVSTCVMYARTKVVFLTLRGSDLLCQLSQFWQDQWSYIIVSGFTIPRVISEFKFSFPQQMNKASSKYIGSKSGVVEP